jgi:hypothetical protein
MLVSPRASCQLSPLSSESISRGVLDVTTSGITFQLLKTLNERGVFDTDVRRDKLDRGESCST